MDSRDVNRYEFVESAQRFIFDVLPLRAPESLSHLNDFLTRATYSSLSLADQDAILLRCLAILDHHSGGVLPSLVDRYISLESVPRKPLDRFKSCVEWLLKYRGIDSPIAQSAIAIIDAEYQDGTLTVSKVAARLNVASCTVTSSFVRQTGLTFAAYLRGIRLDKAAVTLCTTTRTIKEVWIDVGFGDASSFDHAFRKRFQMTPSACRRRGLRTPISSAIECATMPCPTLDKKATRRGNVLLVDRDSATRGSVARYLSAQGYQVHQSENGREGLRRVQEANPAVTVLEFHLPDMSAIEYLRTLKQRCPRLRAAIVFTADWNMEARATEIQQLGATLVLKLCDLEHIGRLIAQAFVLL